MDSRSRARQRPMRRQSPVRNNRRGSTSRPRMDSRSRTRPVRDSRSRSKGRGRPNRQPYRSPPRDPPVDTNPWRKPFSVTPEQRRNSVHVNGYLYATLDWSSPFAPAPWSFEPPERYNHQSRTDPSVTAWKSIPNGWEIAEAFDEVIEKVIKPHSWGTHMLIVEGMKAYWTAAGRKPGNLEALWDYEKGIGRYMLKPKFGGNSTLHGIILMKTVNRAHYH